MTENQQKKIISLEKENGDFDEDAKNVRNLLLKDKIKVCVSNVKIATEKELEEYIIDKEITIPSYLKEYFVGMPNVEFKSFPAMIWPSIDKSEFKEKNMGRKNINYCSALFETITITFQWQCGTLLLRYNGRSCVWQHIRRKCFSNMGKTKLFRV